LIALVSSAVFSVSAQAKTEGAFIGVNIVKSSASSKFVNNLNANTNAGSFDGNSSTELGLEAKYALPVVGNFFIAPGVFYEKLGIESRNMNDDAGLNVSKFTFNNRYGAKLDIGYDLNDSVAAYFTNGVAHVKFKEDYAQDTSDPTLGSTLKSGQTSYFYGIGLLGHVNDNVTIGAEYSTQSVKAPTAGDEEGIFTAQRVKTKLDVYKINVSYRF
jgi:opacity protein-like surface antigen